VVAGWCLCLDSPSEITLEQAKNLAKLELSTRKMDYQGLRLSSQSCHLEVDGAWDIMMCSFVNHPSAGHCCLHACWQNDFCLTLAAWLQSVQQFLEAGSLIKITDACLRIDAPSSETPS
jgi:hypothetical protein